MAHVQKIKFFLLGAAFLLAQPVWAQMPPTALPRAVMVSGQATKQIPADRVVVSLGLVSKNAKLSEAKKHNDELVESLVKIAKEFGIAKDKVSTSNVYISPEYRYEQPSGVQKFNGYQVSRSIRVTIDDMSAYERFLSAAVEAKIDQVAGVEFELIDAKQYAEKMRAEAVADAKQKAQTLVQAAGGKLGAPIHINALGGGAVSHPPMPMMARAMAGASAELAAPPALPGMISLNESVEVHFALE